ncbi:MAG: UDP-N-acetylmuramoyl-L-alanyl-D-glutamate--2,6-diaminopimelate ligase [Phycisphaerales bacterium]|nr:UDP-N-acetylmuramoyl-L-alanyl-D-glutamate--2,6-diaminopimelate ligase [Phycisphaerales bacterium]
MTTDGFKGTSLIQLLDGLPVTCHRVTGDVIVADLVEDARLVKPGDIFLARPGRTADGRQFIKQAQAAGAAAILSDSTGCAEAVIPAIECVDPSMIGARLAERLHGDPSRRLHLIGITGTNGKSTTAMILQHLLDDDRARCGLIGGIHIDDGLRRSTASLTTPQASELSRQLGRMVRNGCTRAVMEVSSHALDLGRVHALSFHGAIFTNLSGDHLDWHGDMVQYAIAKRRLFSMLPRHGIAVLNAEDQRSRFMAQAANCRIIETGAGATAQVVCLDERLDGSRARFEGPWGTFDGIESTIPLVGRHNLANALQAVAMAQQLGVTPEVIAHRLETCPCPAGRLQPVASDDDQPRVFVDFAHTDAALGTTLSGIRRILEPDQRLHVVFGCGGDRDASKRPRMAVAALASADSVTLTSDNPRTEDPAAILKDILTGVPEDRMDDVQVEPDRANAIRHAISSTPPGSVVLIAGKGHERVQLIGSARIPFDDAAVAKSCLDGTDCLQQHLHRLPVLERGGADSDGIPALTGVCTDSREVEPGQLYIALRGPNHDGHDFIEQAVQRGAAALVVERHPGEVSVPWFRVDDSRSALGGLAGFHRDSMESIPVIAVTGTCGKTGTKEVLRSVLSGLGPVCASTRSFNNEIGMPLTLLAARPSHRAVILELGTNSPGEIEYLARIARPDFAIITMIGSGHLAGLETIEGVAREKYALLPWVRERAWVRRDPFPLPESKAPVVQFGDGTTDAIDSIEVDHEGTAFTLADGTRFRLPLVGRHHAFNTVPVILLARQLGMDDVSIQHGLDAVDPPRGRGAVHYIDEIEFVDESYNANPDSMQASIDAFLVDQDQSRNVLILGDMLELGDHAQAMHEALGRAIAEHPAAGSIDLVMLVGQDIQHTLRSLAASGWSGDQLVHEPEIDEPAMRRLASMLQPGDRVLLKGSRGLGLERVHVARSNWDSEVETA